MILEGSFFTVLTCFSESTILSYRFTRLNSRLVLRMITSNRLTLTIRSLRIISVEFLGWRGIIAIWSVLAMVGRKIWNFGGLSMISWLYWTMPVWHIFRFLKQHAWTRIRFFFFLLWRTQQAKTRLPTLSTFWLPETNPMIWGYTQ